MSARYKARAAKNEKLRTKKVIAKVDQIFKDLTTEDDFREIIKTIQETSDPTGVGRQVATQLKQAYRVFDITKYYHFKNGIFKLSPVEANIVQQLALAKWIPIMTDQALKAKLEEASKQKFNDLLDNKSDKSNRDNVPAPNDEPSTGISESS